MISMPILFLLVIGAAVVAIIWRLLAIKELAITAAKKHCRDLDVQFLDGTVVQCGARIKRVSSFRFAILQTFQFEFTPTGEKRYLGWTTFRGRRCLSMELQPHTFPNPSLPGSTMH